MEASEPRRRRAAIVCVDDEPAVLAAVARDLRRQFGERYRIVRATSGAEALERAEGARHARRAGRAAGRRSAHAADGGHRVPGRGAQARAGRQARPADRLRRHRGGDPGDQRGRPRLLPAQAVGPARGAALPGGRGPADHVGGGRGAGVRRRARDRAPLQPRLARPARLPGPQPRADALARRRARHRGARAAAGRRRRLRAAAGGDARGRHGARAPDGARAGRAARRVRRAGRRALRPGDRRRRPGRARRGGLRRVRGAEDGAGRARGAGRPGGHVVADRELPRLPGGAERLRPRAPRDRPGAPARRRAADGPGRRRPARRGRRADRRALGRRHAERELRARRLRRLLPPADHAGLRAPDRQGDLLRRGADRGALVPGPARGRDRRGQLGRPGGGALRRLRAAG